MSDLTSKERALLLLSELDGHLANAKWDANATGRKKLREACDLLRNPSEAGAVQRASNQGFADGYVKAVDDVTTRGFESAMANANQIRHNISSAQVELPADAKRVLYGRYNELVRRSDEPEGPCLFDRLVGNPLDMLKTDCAHDFTFTENKDYGWCVKCKTEYDFAKHGIV